MQLHLLLIFTITASGAFLTKIMDNFTAMLQTTIIKKKEGFAGERACILPNSLKHPLQQNNLCKNLYLTDIGF